jgi:hypothetical protein
MKFKNLRQLEDSMITSVMTSVPKVRVDTGSNVFALAEDLAMLLVDLQYEVDSLQYKYNIAEKDLLPIMAVLLRGESIPARTVQRAHGDKI